MNIYPFVSGYWKFVDSLVLLVFSVEWKFVTFRISSRGNTCTTIVYRVPSTTCSCVCVFVHRSSYSSLNRIDNRHELNGQSIKQANSNPYSEILKYHFITIFSINATIQDGKYKYTRFARYSYVSCVFLRRKDFSVIACKRMYQFEWCSSGWNRFSFGSQLQCLKQTTEFPQKIEDQKNSMHQDL